MNGPVASAGSIPNLSNKSGIKVPISDAMIITETSAIVTIIPIMNSTLRRKWLPRKRIVAKIKPLSKLNETSFINRLNNEPLKVSLAKPCTIIAED